MSNHETKKKPFTFKWIGVVLKVLREEKELRSYDFAKVPTELTDRFTQFGRQTKLANFKASAKAESADPLALMDEGYELLCSGEWEFEREGITRFSEALILLIQRLTKSSREVAVASLKAAGKEKVDAIKAAHSEALAKIEKELADKRTKAEALDLEALALVSTNEKK